MKTMLPVVLIGLVGAVGVSPLNAQNTMVTYQGRVSSGESDFTGTGQFKFALVTSSNNSHQATARANLSGPFVTSYTVTDGGSGYLVAPAVSIFGGGGSGATATVNLSGGVVVGLSPGNAGSGYTSLPTVMIAAPPANMSFTTHWSNDGTSSAGSEPAAAVNVSVANGLFTVVLGDTRQANMAVLSPALFAQPNLQLRIWFNDGVNGFAGLSPVQNLTPAPSALFAHSASNLLGNVAASQVSGPWPASQLSGQVSLAQLPAVLLTNNQSGVNLIGSFAGNGRGLTGLWGTSGNAGSAAGVNFLGTTDNQPLEFKVNGQRALRLEDNGDSIDPDDISDGAPNVIGGSLANRVGAGVVGATIGGGGATNYWGSGYTNKVTGDFGTVVGGLANTASGEFSTAMGKSTTASGAFSTVMGLGSIASDSASTAMGFETTASGGGSTAIGSETTASGYISTATGYETSASGNYSTAMGAETTASGDYSTAMGLRTIASNFVATAMGLETVAGGFYSTAMGYTTIAIGTSSTAMGSLTTAGGYASTAMGAETTAGGDYSTAMGHRAKANHNGSFVWADGQDADFASTANNQFSIRAANGVRFNDGTSLFMGGNLGQKINLWSSTFGLGIQNSVQYSRVGVGGGFAWFAGGVHSDGTFNSGGGTTLMTLTGGGLSVNGTFVSASDRNGKENFAPVEPRAVLEKVAALPLSQWNYKADTRTRHLGPMAQDFYAAFGVGPDDKHIATVDADGVALAAIQGLNQKVEEKEAEIRGLRTRLEKLEQILSDQLSASERK